MRARPVLLCGGLQGSGSTLLSWCFLQRADTAGVLDQYHDRLVEVADLAADVPHLWCKMTIASFTLHECAAYLSWEGFTPRPLLLVRDVRAVWNGLAAKPYGRNGTTAEDPPLRLRLLRFLDDWRRAREAGVPIVRFEDLLATPRPVLTGLVEALGLPWDEAMLDWSGPRPRSKPVTGSRSFLASAGRGFADSIDPNAGELDVSRIARADLDWIDENFAEFHRVLGYVPHVSHDVRETSRPGRDAPNLRATRYFRRNRFKLRVKSSLQRAGLADFRP